jgi:uncharacterized protein (TIGR02118 family)
MFKAVILLTRKPEISPAQFRAWMLEEHAPLARALPGLRRLVFNIVEMEDPAYDGISELWFDTREAFDAAYATEIGKRVAGDSLAHVTSRTRLFVDEQVQVG